MNKLFALGAAGLALATFPTIAHAEAGDVQAKLLGTLVAPDGKITDLPVPLAGVTDGLQTKANDNFVPTVSIEYYFTDNFSVETICCMTQHDVDATTGLPGAELVSNAKVIPATLTAKYHFDLGSVKPYVGAGPTYFLWVGEKPGADTLPLDVTDTTFSDELGLVLQAGLDIDVGKKGFGISFDAKRYFVDTKARWYVGDALVIQTTHKLDPWVVSAGVSYTF